MPQLAHICNLWTLVGHPSAAKPWSLARQIKAVADAGFDGITTALTPEHRRLAERCGLQHLLGFISDNTGDPAHYTTALRAQKEAGAVHINVQLDDHDTPPAVAARHWVQLVRAAEKIGGLLPSLEVHRDCCTETPEKTYEIAERVQKATGEPCRLTFDFSHLAVVKHLHPGNYAARLLTHPDLVQHSQQIHFRPFNGHHAQIPVTHRGRLAPELTDWLGFLHEVLRLWKSAPQNRDRTLYACPELGPKAGGYALSVFPPSWPETCRLREEIDGAWRTASSRARR
jgi:sugar phosphate isomerase/epimerase